MQWRANGSASSRFSEIGSLHRSQFPNAPSSSFWSAETTSRRSRRSPLPSSKKNSRVYAVLAWSPRSLIESSSASLPYKAVRPTSSVSWRCFSTSCFLKYASRSLRIWASFRTKRARTQVSNASMHSGSAQHEPRPQQARPSRIVERQGRRVAPEALERVVAARLFQKYVHQQVAVVEQHPAALGDALGVEHIDALAAQLDADRFRDRLQLRRRLAAADEEEVRHARHALHVEHDEIAGALVERGARRAAGFPLGRRRRHGPSAR